VRRIFVSLLAAGVLAGAAPAHAVVFTILENPNLRFLEDSTANVDGVCFCTLIDGGSFGLGALLRKESDGSKTVVYSFSGPDGALPHGGLVARSSTIYGTTLAGGSFGFGTIYSYVPATGVLTTLFSFNGYNGADPHGGVVIDSAGNLFGSTAFGGAHNRGTLFKLSSNGVFSTLVTFDGSNGGRPDDRLLVDTRGWIYGHATDGGPNDQGVVFRLTDVGYIGVGEVAVPEPASWAMLIAGFGLIGAAQRRRRKSIV
jgi:uncharacterized repeat protein (TIGR03803 family)